MQEKKKNICNVHEIQDLITGEFQDADKYVTGKVHYSKITIFWQLLEHQEQEQGHEIGINTSLQVGKQF